MWSTKLTFFPWKKSKDEKVYVESQQEIENRIDIPSPICYQETKQPYQGGFGVWKWINATD